MLLIDPTKTQTRVQRNPREGTVVKHLDHFDGSTDAKVHLRTIRIKLVAAEGAPLNVEQIKALGVFEEANRAYIIAKHSGSDEWRDHAFQRLEYARRRLEDNQ